MHKYKINDNIIFNESDDCITCCFIDNTVEHLIELRASALKTFNAIKLAKSDTFRHDDPVLKNLLALKLIEKVDEKTQTPHSKIQLADDDLKKLGISINYLDDVFSSELESYGFSTLTATNSSSYCDTS